MYRLSVVGAAGSGKSTFARRLASHLGVRHVEFDALYWGPQWTPRPRDDFLADGERAVAGDAWVIDSNYSNLRPAVWARVVQHFLPRSEIVKGAVWTGVRHEIHFWNELTVGDDVIAIDLTWQQFPAGSVVTARETLDRDALGDGAATVVRCELLLADVQARLRRAA